jgi:hypothetical protein
MGSPSVPEMQGIHSLSRRLLALAGIGYSVAALALVTFLTINGQPNVSQSASIATILLIAIGFLTPAIGLILLTRGPRVLKTRAKSGLLLQGIGLISLFFGIVIAVVTVSFTGFLVAAVVLTFSSSTGLLGATFFKRYYRSASPLSSKVIDFNLLGLTLLFLGVALILGSQIVYSLYYFSPVWNIVYQDIGASVSACGCVLLAYGFNRLLDYSRRKVEKRFNSESSTSRASMV